MTDATAERDLLLRHLPILRFDHRELFFPVAVDDYVEHCALVVGGHEVAEPGAAAIDDLDHRLGADSHLRFVSEADRRSVVKEEARRLAGKLLGPRLGRVGFFGRLLDALFLLSVLVRPTTPRLTTVAASLKAERHRLHRRATCYGRVVSVGDWVVLHYAYFYVMNDWRSGYRGVNDHEGDWEQAWVFCDPADSTPIWVVASSHENRGADLRRHWSDPELVRDGDRPVLYAGAGSHALFFRPGDYISRIEIPALKPLLRVRRWSRTALRIREDETDRGLGPALGAPFVDAAPGDGREIADWDFVALDESRDLFGSFRGLWGLDTGDPLGSERAPAGPKFERSGDVRLSWADPVGFAGLHGTAPPSLADPQASLDSIEAGLAYVEAELRQAARLQSLVGAEGEEQSEAISSLLRQRTELQDLRLRLQRGEAEVSGVRDHLVNPAIPILRPRDSGWVMAVWAAVSVPLVMLALAAPLVLSDVRVLGGLLGLAAAFTVLEQLVRRRFNAALRLTVFYVAVAALFGFVSVITVSRYAAGAALAVAAVVLLIGNVGELGALRRRPEVAEAVPPTSFSSPSPYDSRPRSRPPGPR